MNTYTLIYIYHIIRNVIHTKSYVILVKFVFYHTKRTSLLEPIICITFLECNFLLCLAELDWKQLGLVQLTRSNCRSIFSD